MDVERLDDLRELIGEYWCLAFAEGQEGRHTDTPDSAAQKCICAIEAIIREARTALTPPEGHIVVTRNEAGQAVAVTRQDDEGRILSVIAEFEAPEGCVLVPVELLRMVIGCAYPVSTDINQRGYAWSEAYLDQVLPSVKAALAAARPEVRP